MLIQQMHSPHGQVYTAGPATLQDLPPLVPSSYASGAVRGEWTQRTAGGCSNSAPGKQYVV